MKKLYWKRYIAGLLVSAMFLPVTGCGKQENTEETGADKQEVRYVLTTGFSKGEIFKIEDQTCTEAEIMLYLTNIQNQYESVYGEKIWEISVDDITLEDNIKEVVLSKMAQLKCMYLLSKEYGITLTETEENKLKTAAKEYYQSLKEEEIAQMGITMETVEELYREYLLANKVYEDIIKDVNPEISDDEARSIKVESILIKTTKTDASGNNQADSDYEKQVAYQKAQEVLQKVSEGVSFEDLVNIYNEDSKSVYSFGKGDMDEAFETAAYNLDTDEVSGIVETQYGYHIIKCLSTFDEEETNANKVKILAERKNEAFNEVYNTFVAGLTKYINEEEWEKISILQNNDVTNINLFEIYDKYFNY